VPGFKNVVGKTKVRHVGRLLVKHADGTVEEYRYGDEHGDEDWSDPAWE
jgi:hypothetical protein